MDTEMNETSAREGGTEQQTAVRESFARWDAALVFGPSFFMRQLGAYIRDRCPEASEVLPFVHVRLTNGESLDVCHVIGLSTRWVALATYRESSSGMATELVPYECITRITIEPGQAEGARIGFQQKTPPTLEETAEEVLLRAATRGVSMQEGSGSGEARLPSARIGGLEGIDEGARS